MLGDVEMQMLGMNAGVDVLSLIGEGEEEPSQTRNQRGRPRARGRGTGRRRTAASGEGTAWNAMDVLSLIAERDEQPPQAREPRGRRPAKGSGRGISARPVASAMDALALIGDEDEHPPQAREPLGRPRGRATSLHKHRHLQSVRNQKKVLRFQMQKFNASGRAVNVDGLMLDAAPRLGKKGRRPKIKVGKGGWKRYLPETIQRMAFSAGSTRQIAASFADTHGPNSGGKRAAHCITESRAVCARTIKHGQEHGLQNLYMRSTASDQGFRFWITNNMFDETKLWYIVPGKGFRHWSTLAHHEQITWAEGTNTFDEHVFHTAKALRRYSSAGQWAVMREIMQRRRRPRARNYGGLTTSDSHPVNTLMMKHVRAVSPATDVMLPNYCIQHHTGRCATDIAVDLKLFTRVWCLAKTFSEGDFHTDLEEIIGEILEDDEVGLEVVNPEEFELAPGDLKRDFTESIMDRCFQHGSELGGRTASGQGEESASGQGEAEKLKEDFVAFFPFGWNRRRVLHPCPAGCCGPTPCHDRATSVLRSRELVGRVILKRITQPAQNKWTKMDPAFQQTTLVVFFFLLIKQALERKSRITYEAVVARYGLGPGGDAILEAENGGEAKKHQAVRYSRRSLLFVGDTETQHSLLIWSVVGAVIMNIHYRLFKHVSWYSDGDDEGYTAFDVCPGCKPERNPAILALTAIAKIMFDPNGSGKSFLGPIYFFFGGTVQWPERVLANLQRELVVAFCKLWRSLFHTFKRNPWPLAKVFNTETPMAEREKGARELWDMKACCVDAWCGQPLRGSICESWRSLFEPHLHDFMRAMFLRCVLTSTFIEKCFAPLTTFTAAFRSRHTLPSVAGHHLLTVFDEVVNKWWETLDPAPTSCNKSRPVTVKGSPEGAHTCGWHLYVAENPPAHRSSHQEAIAEVHDKMAAWKRLPPEEQAPYIAKAKKQRLVANNQGSALDKALRDGFEECGGPWRLSACHRFSRPWARQDNSHGLGPEKLPADWPIARVHIEQQMKDLNLATSLQHWQREEGKVWEEDLDFPDTVSMAEPCFEGECLAMLTEAQRGQVAALSKYLRLVLRNTGLPPELLPCVEFRGGGHIIYVLVGDQGWTHEIRCELISLKRPGGANGLGPGGSDGLGPGGSGDEDVAPLPFELAMVQDVHCVHLDFAWPRVESERAFVRRLVTLSSGPWEMYSLKAVCEEVSTFIVEERTFMDLGALEEAEVQRLVQLHAMNLLKKADKIRAGQMEQKRGRPKRGGKALPRRAGRSIASGDNGSSSESLGSRSPDGLRPGSLDGLRPGSPDGLRPGSPKGAASSSKPDGLRPGSPDSLRPGTARKHKRGIPWGVGGWQLAEIANASGEIIGCGAICKNHVDHAGDTVTCKKHVTFGKSGLTSQDLMLRLKRWLIAGLDDSNWDADGQRSQHLSMGGVFLREFADGLSEEACDKIADSVAPPPA